MMFFLLVAAIAAVVALSLHHYQWRRGATGQHVLVVLPAALLFVVMPIPVLMLQTIQGFQRIAAVQGAGSYSAAAAMSLEINRALWLGSLGVLLTMAVAGLLQWRASAADVDDASEVPRTWREWVLLACALLVIPAALVTYIAGEVPRTIGVAMEMITGAGPSRLPSSELSNFSAKISSLLVTGFIGGLVLTVADLLAAAAAVLVASGVRRPRRSDRSGVVLLAILLIAAAWSAMQLPVERRWIERVAASAAQHDANLPR